MIFAFLHVKLGGLVVQKGGIAPLQASLL
jgi:hypothetical protein